MNEPQILKEHHIFKETQSTKKPQILKECQISKQTQATNEKQNFKRTLNFQSNPNYK
jgi:hypothetical protein